MAATMTYVARMPCTYNSCPNADDPFDMMLVCSTNTAHTAHLTCWAKWCVESEVVGCPVENCLGSATSGTMGASEVRDLVRREMQAQIAEIQPTLTSSDASVTEWTYGETYDEDTSDVSG